MKDNKIHLVNNIKSIINGIFKDYNILDINVIELTGVITKDIPNASVGMTSPIEIHNQSISYHNLNKIIYDKIRDLLIKEDYCHLLYISTRIFEDKPNSIILTFREEYIII